jgi:hypothetical protein
MPVCVSEARPGGKIRYGGRTARAVPRDRQYLELVPFSLIIHVDSCTCPTRRRAAALKLGSSRTRPAR